MKNIIILLLLISFADADFIRDNKKEIVTDSETCLMWQDNNASKIVKKKWQDAIEYCKDLTLGEYEDWRLPNINELGSIIDKTKYNPAIKNSFKYFTYSQDMSSFDWSSDYWSSTTSTENSNRAWRVYFYGGNQYDGSFKDGSSHIRCVRAGQ